MRRIGLTLALGGLMVVVDTTVTIVAIPAMVAGLHSTLPAVQWVTTGYLLGLVAAIPAAGWLVARFGARRVYVLALLAFTLFSALAGLAGSARTLAVFRIAQGLGGGLLNPVGQAIGLRAVPREHRGRLMALLGLPLMIGPVLGPPLAGWLVDTASWRWIFLVNVPVGALAIVLSRRLLPPDPRTAAPAPRPDRLGLGLLPAGAALLVLGGPGLLVGPALLITFVLRSRRVPDPLVDLSLLRHRPLRTGLVVLASFGAAYFGAITVLPIFVQGVRGDPATLAGALAVPQALAVGVTVQIATRLVDRVPPRRVVVTGTATALAGAATLLVATTTNTSYAVIVAGTVLLGVGSGATLLPTMTIAVRDLDATATPQGTTLLALVQQLSAALGVALTTAVLTASLGDLAEVMSRPQADQASLAPAAGIAYAVTAALIAVSLIVAARSLRPAVPGSTTAPERPAGPAHRRSPAPAPGSARPADPR